MRRRTRWLAAGLLAVLAAAGGLSAVPAVSAAPSVSAVSAVLYEPVSGTVLFEKDAHTPRAMASTTKLMTALLAAESGDWEREVEVTAPMVAVEGSSLGLRAGDRLTLRDLTSGMLLTSGNDAAGAIAVALAGSLPAFAGRMNAKAAALGMTDSHFVTPSGLDAEGHEASAYDMALLGAAVLTDDTLADICARTSDTIHISGRAVTVVNHNRLLKLYEGAVGLKTGFTKKAGRCLVSAAERDGVTLIAVTLNDADDWNDHMALFDYGFSLVRAVELPCPVLEDLPVAGGTAGQTALCVPEPPPVVLPAACTGTVRMTVRLPAFVFAPLEAGDTVGEVTYTLDGETLAALPVTAAEGVPARPLRRTGGQYGETLRRLWRGLVC